MFWEPDRQWRKLQASTIHYTITTSAQFDQICGVLEKAKHMTVAKIYQIVQRTTCPPARNLHSPDAWRSKTKIKKKRNKSPQHISHHACCRRMACVRVRTCFTIHNSQLTPAEAQHVVAPRQAVRDGDEVDDVEVEARRPERGLFGTQVGSTCVYARECVVLSLLSQLPLVMNEHTCFRFRIGRREIISFFVLFFWSTL